MRYDPDLNDGEERGYSTSKSAYTDRFWAVQMRVLWKDGDGVRERESRTGKARREECGVEEGEIG